MGFLTLSTVLYLCLSTSLATYGPDHHRNHESKSYHEASKDEHRIHWDSPKIILNKPSINIEGAGHSSLLDNGWKVLENDKHLYSRSALHGIPASHASHSPIILDSGYGSGKVLDASAPIQVLNHSPVQHEQAILIRRPIVVSKGLTSTQDRLEKLHYAHTGHAHSADYGHAASGYAIPKAIHERTIVYGGHSLGGHGLGGHGLGGHGLGYGLGHGLSHGLGHGLAHGLSVVPAPLILSQPKAYLGHGDIGYSSDKALHGEVLHGGDLHGGALYGGSSHGGSLHGDYLHGGSLHGGSLHGGSLHGGSLHGDYLHGSPLHGGSLHGGSLHGGSIHGGSLHGGSIHGGSLHGGSIHGGSLHGSSLHGAALHGGSLHGAALHGAGPKKY